MRRCQGGEWDSVFKKSLTSNEVLQDKEMADIPLPLAVKPKTCHYQVVLHYDRIGEVKSAEPYKLEVNSIG